VRGVPPVGAAVAAELGVAWSRCGRNPRTVLARRAFAVAGTARRSGCDVGLIADERLRINRRHLDNKNSTTQHATISRTGPEDLPVLVGDAHRNDDGAAAAVTGP